jgi:hypothetical protein
MAKSFIVILSILFGMMVSIECQTWAGNYTIGGSCNTTACCCFNGTLTITAQNSSTFSLSSPSIGTCNQTYVNGTFSQTVTANNYSISATIGGQGYSLSLSNSSQTITTTINASSALCYSTATKSTASANGIIPYYYSIWWWCFAIIMILI